MCFICDFNCALLQNYEAAAIIPLLKRYVHYQYLFEYHNPYVFTWFEGYEFSLF